MKYQSNYRETHKDKIKECGKKYYLLNKECIKKKQANYYQENKKTILERIKKHYYLHKDKIKKQRKICFQNLSEVKKQARKYYLQNYRDTHKDQKKQYTKKYQENHKEHINQCKKIYLKLHSEQRKEYLKKYRKNHRLKSIIYERKYRKNNLGKVRAWGRVWGKKNYEIKKKDLTFNLNHKISSAIRGSLKHSKAGKHWEILVGYTITDLKQHLEKQFTKGMAWKKFMTGEIHVDHIVPISHFKYKSIEDPQFKECWALYNLQPLWAKDNIIKSNKNYQLPLFIGG